MDKDYCNGTHPIKNSNHDNGFFPKNWFLNSITIKGTFLEVIFFACQLETN